MSETLFTPGPWTVGKLVVCQEESSNCWHTFSYQRDIFPPLGEAGPVAIVSHEDAADAHLIAAAPDLYAALERFVSAAESWHNFHNHTDIQCDSLCACIEPGKAALAKAHGEEPKP